MSERKETSFGLYETLSTNPLVERMTFNRQGKPHTHEGDELCYVLNGSGRVIGSDRREVEKGDLCRVPAGTEHYMIPIETPFELLIFYD